MLFGWPGVRLRRTSLLVRPALPEGVALYRVHRLQYAGNTLDLAFTRTQATLISRVLNGTRQDAPFVQLCIVNSTSGAQTPLCVGGTPTRVPLTDNSSYAGGGFEIAACSDARACTVPQPTATPTPTPPPGGDAGGLTQTAIVVLSSVGGAAVLGALAAWWCCCARPSRAHETGVSASGIYGAMSGTAPASSSVFATDDNSYYPSAVSNYQRLVGADPYAVDPRARLPSYAQARSSSSTSSAPGSGVYLTSGVADASSSNSATPSTSWTRAGGALAAAASPSPRSSSFLVEH